MKKTLHLLFATAVICALVSVAVAQQQSQSTTADNPLVRLLQSKGILTDEEASRVNQASSPREFNQRLAGLLLSKGLITQVDYDQTVGASAVPAVADSSSSSGRLVPAVLRTSTQAATPQAAPQKPAPPPIIPAIAPIRVLQVDPPKQGGLVPDIKLGSGAKLKFYGFFKSSVVYDSSSQQGNDFPLPGFIADSGPNGSPEFHIKARSFRAGANFEWPDLAGSKNTLTGRIEFDFEGNFTRVNNRNISAIRSSQPSIRLAWMRLDHTVSDKTTVYALFGQDWTPFGSSTLPNLLETTGLGIGFGTLYERAPQVRAGINHKVGGSRNFAINPEFAIVLPTFGNLPTDISNQLGYGERQGVDSALPELEGRVVFQFQLDKAKGVAPAQIIFSGMHGSRKEIVLRANVPAAPAAFLTAFPRGAEFDSHRNGWTAEIQLPTRYVTLIAKYYNGSDLRFFFAGQILSEFNDFGWTPTGTTLIPATLTSITSTTALDGTTVWFALNGGTPYLVPQRPVRSQGGFVNLGFPLSRIANAKADGRHAGWTMYLHYGFDQALARDARRAFFTAPATASGGRGRSSLAAANIQYKLNQYVTFGYELSHYRTQAVDGLHLSTAAPQVCGADTSTRLPLFNGFRQCNMHDLRGEFATIFTF